jgi:hypothetical protein
MEEIPSSVIPSKFELDDTYGIIRRSSNRMDWRFGDSNAQGFVVRASSCEEVWLEELAGSPFDVAVCIMDAASISITLPGTFQKKETT